MSAYSVFDAGWVNLRLIRHEQQQVLLLRSSPSVALFNGSVVIPVSVWSRLCTKAVSWICLHWTYSVRFTGKIILS